MIKTQFFTRALAALAVVGALAVTAPTGVPGAPQAASAVGDCTPGSDWGTPRQDLVARVVELVNQHRASKGLSSLTISTTLTNASVWKARHMAKYVYMSHNDPAPPVARTTAERLQACGYPTTTYGWGENIAYGYATADAVMQGWLNSPGHRANIERSSYRSLGVGAASSSTGRIYWAQAFGTQSSGSTPPPPPPTTYACSNGKDDDGDLKVDYPADPGCTSSTDNDEYNAPQPPPPTTYACSNSKDDDGDLKVDYPADPGCTSSTDNDEYNAPQPPPPTTYACSNGKDDDGDGKVDLADPGCTSSSDNDEYNAPAPPPPTGPACSNGKDDDGDGKMDMADPGCTSPTDPSEFNLFSFGSYTP